MSGLGFIILFLFCLLFFVLISSLTRHINLRLTIFRSLIGHPNMHWTSDNSPCTLQKAHLGTVHKCYSTVTCKLFLESTSRLLNQPQCKLGQSCVNSWHKIDRHATKWLKRDVQIPTFDKHFPVILLAIGQWSFDLKHLISGNGPLQFQG